jgi:hypothetical protein
MKLYSAKVPSISTQLVRELIQQNMIAVRPEDVSEVEADISAVLREYIRVDHEVTERAKDKMERHQISRESFPRVRKEVARERGFPIEDPLAYILGQIIEILLHSNFVDEVFGEDNDLRRIMKPVFQRFVAADSALDQEVRAQIRNLQEGTQTWEIEYQRALGEIKRRKGLLD